LNKFDVDSIDDPIIKSMANILKVQAKGLDLNRALGRAISTGDISVIDYAYIAEKGGAAARDIAEVAKGIVQSINAKSEQVTNAVFASVGGEANWDAATAVFNKDAPKAIRVTVAQMLDSSRPDLIQAAAQIVAEFGKNSTSLPFQGNPNTVFAAGPGTAGALTRQQFQQELRNLKPDTPDYVRVRETLFQRRALGKRQGI
jgi:hypothetical protein